MGIRIFSVSIVSIALEKLSTMNLKMKPVSNDMIVMNLAKDVVRECIGSQFTNH